MRRSTVHTRSDSPLVQRPERPAGRPTEAPNHLHSQSAQQRILQEHVTRVASGEGSSARAVDLHQLQILPPRGGRLAAGAPASSSPPDRRCSPRRGLRRGQIVEERCHLAAAHEAPRAAAPRAPQPIWLRRAARGWAALRTPSRVLLAVGDAQHAALLHDRGPSKFLRQTAPQLELTGSAGLVVSQRLADAADGLREGPGRPSAARRPGRATARWRVELPNLEGGE